MIAVGLVERATVGLGAKIVTKPEYEFVACPGQQNAYCPCRERDRYKQE